MAQVDWAWCDKGPFCSVMLHVRLLRFSLTVFLPGRFHACRRHEHDVAHTTHTPQFATIDLASTRTHLSTHQKRPSVVYGFHDTKASCLLHSHPRV